MSPGLNDPCHCGSGRAHKHCCAPLKAVPDDDAGSGATEDEAALEDEPLLMGESERRAAAAAAHWDIDAIPLLITLAEEHDAGRPVAVLALADEFPLFVDVLPRLAGQPESVAEALKEALMRVALAAGAYPRTVRIRYPEVADLLRELLAPLGISVEAVDALPELAAAACTMMENVVGTWRWPPVCRVDSCTDWDLPRPELTALFRAAAGFWRAAPWKTVADLQAPRATLPSGREWTASVMGMSGQQLGISLYSVASDLFEGQPATDPSGGFSFVTGRMIGIAYGGAANFTSKARREIRSLRLEIAGPEAYPDVLTVNTPGGGLSAEDAGDFAALLRALPDFVNAHAEAFEAEAETGTPMPILPWLHEPTGVTLRYGGEAALAFQANAAVSEALLEALEAAFDDLEGGGGTASLLEALGQHVPALAEVLNGPHPDLGGLTLEQTRILMQHDWLEGSPAARVRTDLRPEEVSNAALHRNVRILLERAAELGSLRATPAGNLKVAEVDALSARMQLSEEGAPPFQTWSKRVTERDVWPLHMARILAELAGLIERRGSRFFLTPAGRGLLAPELAGELHALLFKSWLERFDMTYGSIRAWPELQVQVTFTLYRLSVIDADWLTPAEIVDEKTILEYALDTMSDYPGFDLVAGLFERQVLRPLVSLGLLERRDPPADWQGADARYRRAPLFERFLTFDLEGGL